MKFNNFQPEPRNNPNATIFGPYKNKNNPEIKIKNNKKRFSLSLLLK